MPANSSTPDARDARLLQLLKLAESEPADPFVLYGLGQEYARRGRCDEAVAWYDRCVAIDPNYCYAYFHKARALEDAGRTPEALTALRSGLERARAIGDAHAASEIAAFLDELT